MAADQLRAFLDLIGAVLQVAGSILMLVLVALLQRRTRVAYFGWWTTAWLLLAIAVSSVGAVMLVPRLLGTVDAAAAWYVRPLVAVYQVGKVSAFAAFLLGTLVYAGVPVGRRWRLLLGSYLVTGIGTAVLSPPLDVLVRVQAPLAAAAFLCCAVLLFRLPEERRGFGTRFTAFAFCLGAVLWSVYMLAFGYRGLGPDAPHLELLRRVVRYNTFADFLFTTSLGLGMVVILLEDAMRDLVLAKRSAEDANVELAAAHDRLHRVATTDALTGCLNRQGLQDWLARQAAPTVQGSVLVLDMDNLKPVNDAHGHGAGDAMLRQLAAVLRPLVGNDALLCRWGGDEFLLVLPGQSPSEAEGRCRAVLADAPPLQLPGFPVGIPVQASVGAAAFDGLDDVPAAIRRADGGMYRQKQRRKLQTGSHPATLG